MKVWVAFARGEFFGEDLPPGPRRFVGVYGTEAEALEECWPPGDPLFVEEREVAAASDTQPSESAPPIAPTGSSPREGT